MLLNKKTCVCGEDLRTEPFTNYVPNRDITFYAGNVDMMGECVCKCGRTLKGFFKRDDRGDLQLIDLEVLKDIEEFANDINVGGNEETTDIETMDEADMKTDEIEPTSDMGTTEKVENKPTSKAKKK